jgi:hypothetical protein
MDFAANTPHFIGSVCAIISILLFHRSDEDELEIEEMRAQGREKKPER